VRQLLHSVTFFDDKMTSVYIVKLCKLDCVNKISPLSRAWPRMMSFSINTGPINKNSTSESS
jgi:hypothetical protein